MAKFIILAIYFFIFGNWLISFTSLDEGRNMTVVYNMLMSSDYVSPVYNCQPRFEKPPMLYWLVSLSSFIFGFNEFSARLVSGASAVGVAFITYLLAKHFFSENIAKKSFLILLTFPHLWIESRAVVPEMINTFFMILSLYLFIKDRVIFGWLSLAFAFLSKGPVGVILVLGAYFILKRDFKILNLKAILIFFVVGSSWYLFMINQYGYEYFYKFFIYENIMRYTGHRLTHPYPIYYYLVVILVGTFYYVPLYPKLIKDFRKEWTNFLLWFIFIIVFFSLAKNKLHHYIIFAYPPLAILLSNVTGEKYLKYTLIIAFVILLALMPVIYQYEKERFVPKAYSVVKNYESRVSFYKTEDSALVFYSQRCIEKIEKLNKFNGLVITDERHIKELNCSELLRGKEFDKTYFLLECN